MIGQARRVLAIAANDLRVEFADRAIWLMLFVCLVFPRSLGAGQGGGTPGLAVLRPRPVAELGGAGGGRSRPARRSTCGPSARPKRTGRWGRRGQGVLEIPAGLEAAVTAGRDASVRLRTGPRDSRPSSWAGSGDGG